MLYRKIKPLLLSHDRLYISIHTDTQERINALLDFIFNLLTMGEPVPVGM